MPLLAKLGDADARRTGPALEGLQEKLARDFASKLRSFQKNLEPRPVAPGDMPPELRQRYVGASGRFLIRIQPAVDIWERAGAERFVTDLRRADPDVTGPPITSFEAIRFIRSGYFEGTLYALGLGGRDHRGLLRSARGTVLALIPLGSGVLWTLGLMHVVGPGVQSRQRLGPAPDHRHGGRVRPQHLPAIPGGAPTGRRHARAEHGHGGRPQRVHHDGGIRQPDGGPPSRDLQPRPAPHHRDDHQPHRLPGRAARVAAAFRRTAGARGTTGAGRRHRVV